MRKCRKYSFRVGKKVRVFYFESVKIDILKKSHGNLKKFNTVDLMPLKVMQQYFIDTPINFTVITELKLPTGEKLPKR